MYKILSFLIVFLTISPTVSAQINAAILLTEVNFKHKEQDFIKFKVFNPQNNSTNLKGLQFVDDQPFKTITEDFIVENNQEITLTFKSELEDEKHHLHTSHKGLTATTEQLYLQANNSILDFVCWQNSNPSNSEIAEFNNISTQAAWSGNCLDSEQIEPNESIFRVKKDRNINSWTIPNQLIVPSSHDFSELIFVSELLPNPAGSDDGAEWIEFQNRDSKPINLNKWSLKKDPSKQIYEIPSLLIRPGECRAINIENIDLKLSNQASTLQLFDPNQKLIQTVKYPAAPESKSYSLLTINNQSEWQWADSPTPNLPNPTLITETGIISAPPSTDIPHQITAKIDDQNWDILFTEDLIKAPLAKATFKTNAEFNFTGEITEPQKMQLYNFSEISKPENNENKPNYDIILSVIVILVIIFIAVRKWKKSISPSPS